LLQHAAADAATVQTDQNDSERFNLAQNGPTLKPAQTGSNRLKPGGWN